MEVVQDQPEVEANEETVKTDGQIPTEKNHEKQLPDGETKCETSNVEEENPKKKKKVMTLNFVLIGTENIQWVSFFVVQESTPKVKKAPGIRRKVSNIFQTEKFFFS